MNKFSKINTIIGIGNPGDEYIHSRHSTGIYFINELVKNSNIISGPTNKFLCNCYSIKLCEKKINVYTSNAYMNLSGSVVLKIKNFFKIDDDSVLIVHDDLDIKVGEYKIVFNGGHGGHNGIRNIIQLIGTSKFWRLKIGISRPNTKNKDLIAKYVLRNPLEDEKILIENSINESILEIKKLINT